MTDHRLRRLLRHLLCALIAAAIAIAAPQLQAQPRPDAGAPAADVTPPEPEAAADSPRAAVRQFVALTSAGEYQEAARYLDVPASRTAAAGDLAKRLKSVLDRHMLGEATLASRASPYSSGDLADKLPPGVDELGRIPGPQGPEPVRLIRKATPNGTIWVFSRSTVDRIDVWYGRLAERWLFDSLPEPLLRPGPFEILAWQYLALPLLIFGSWLAGRALGYVTRKLIGKAVARTSSSWDDAMIAKIGPPLTLAWGLGAFALLVPWLNLYEPARDTIGKVIRAGFLVALFWSGLRAIDVTKGFLLDATAPGLATARSLVPLGAKMVKLILIATALVAVLSELGYPVASLIAGLGIGGIAIALAAQKTVENLFGSVSIGVDQPFRIGDFVKIEDLVGTVEMIGLRSTRIRTLDRTLVTIPNGKLAEMRIESYTARDRFRLHAIIGVVYGTTAAQLREIVAGLEAAMRAETTFFEDSFMIVVKGFGASSIDIEVMGWFTAGTYDAFVKVRQAVLLRFMEVVEKNGTSFAFPTQTVHLIPEQSGA